MKELIKILNNKELEFLKELELDNIGDIIEIEERIINFMQLNCIKNDELDEKGILCEEILNKIGNI